MYALIRCKLLKINKHNNLYCDKFLLYSINNDGIGIIF